MPPASVSLSKRNIRNIAVAEPDPGLADILAAMAPARHIPPIACIARFVCARIGPCDRSTAGSPCQIGGRP
jgi:hypothetical protein